MRLLRTFWAVAVALFLVNNTSEAETYYAMNKGLWSDCENWTLNSDAATYENPNKAVPGAGDDVVIRSGESIVLDQVITDLNSLTVDGTLELKVPGARFMLMMQAGHTVDGSGTISMPGWEDTSVGGWDGGQKGGWNIDMPWESIEPFAAKGTFVFTGRARLPYGYGSQAGAANKYPNRHLQFFNVVVEKNANLVVFNRSNINGTLHVKGQVDAWYADRSVFPTYNNVTIDAGGVFTGVDRGNEKEKILCLKGDLICNGKLNFCSVLTDPMTSNKGWKITLRFVGDQNQEVRFGGDSQECRLGRMEFEKVKNANAIPEVRIYSTVASKVKFREYTEDTDMKSTRLIELLESWKGDAARVYPCQVRLVLGENIIINRLGKGYDKTKNTRIYKVYQGNDVPTTFDSADDPSFFIRQGNEVVIAGANISMGSTGNNVGFIHLQGKLSMLSGSLTMDDGSHGILYSNTKGQLVVEDGKITTTTIYPMNDDDKNALDLTINGGTLSLSKQMTMLDYGSLYIYERAKDESGMASFFRMSGGQIELTTSSGRGYRGLLLQIGESHQSVTGGKVVVKNTLSSGRDFHMQTNVPFYDLEVTNSTIYFDATPEITVSRNLTLNDKVTLTSVNAINVGRDLSWLTQSGFNGKWRFFGSANTVINDRSASGLTFGEVVVEKSNANATVMMNNNKTLILSGNITMKQGILAGKVKLTGSNQQIAQEGGSLTNAGFDFGSAQTSAQIVTNVSLSTVTGLTTAKPLLLGKYRLRIGSASFGSATEKLFITNGKPNTGGLTLPVRAGQKQCFPVAARNSDGVLEDVGAEITSKGENGYFTVEPALEPHFGLAESAEPGKKSDVLYYYWRIGWEGTNPSKGFDMVFYHNSSEKLNGNGALLGCFFYETVWHYYPSPSCTNTQTGKKGVRGHLDFKGFDADGAYGKNWTGDVTFGKRQEVKTETFFSRTTGYTDSFWTDRYSWTTDTTTNVAANNYPTSLDKVVIRDGHVIKINTPAVKQPRLALLLDIQTKGVLKVAKEATGYSINQIIGDGTIKYEYGQNGFKNWVESDYENFCNRPNARIEFEMWNDAVAGQKELPLSTFPTLAFSSYNKAAMYNDGNAYCIADFSIKDNQPLVVNQNLELTDVALQTTQWAQPAMVCKNITLNANASIDADAKSGNTLTVKGDIVNNGHLRRTEGTYLYGNVENNGTMWFKTEDLQMVGAASVSIRGSQPITVEALHLLKDNATAKVTVSTALQSKDYQGRIKTELRRGTLHLNVPSAQWTLTNMSYKSLDIYEEATLIVDSKSKLVVGGWRDGNYNESNQEYNDRVSVWLCGGLIAQGGSQIDAVVGEQRNGQTFNCGIAYWNTGRSTLKLLASSGLRAAFLAPDNVNNASLEYYQSNGTLTLTGGVLTRAEGYAATLDIQGGKFTTLSKAVIDIKDFCRVKGQNNDANSHFLNLQPTTASMSAQTLFKVYPASSWGCATVRSDFNLPNFTVVGGRKGPMLVQDLTVDGELVVNGLLRTSPDNGHNHFNLTINGTATFASAGSFETDNGEKVGKAQLILAGTNPKVVVTKAGDNLKACNIVVRASGTATLPTITALSNLTVESGDVVLTGAMTVDGNVTTAKGTTIKGNTLTMTGAAPTLGTYNPKLASRGSIETLKISSDKMVDASVQQDEPITITKELNLDKAQFAIGVNELQIGKGASITGNVGTEGFIISTFDETARGITFLLNSKTLQGTIPFRLKNVKTEEYMPIEMNFNFATVGDAAQVSIKPVATKHTVLRNVQTDALDFFWTVEYSGVTASKTADCGLTVTINKSHAPNYGASTNPYKRGALAQGEVQWRVLDGGIAEEGDQLKIELPYAGNCDYTIARDLPDIKGYISVADGKAFGEPIWKVCDSNGQPSGEPLTLTSADLVGVQLFVNSNVVVDENNVRPYVTTIRPSGTLDFGTTKNHNLGRLYGSGVMRQAHGKLPSTKTLDFFSEAGGTIEFYGQTADANYDIISTYSRVKNLVVNGVSAKIGGSVTNICGNLTVKGNARLSLATNVELKGNLTMEQGSTMQNNTGDAGILKFDGTQKQTVDVPQQSIKVEMVVNGAGLQLTNSMDLSSKMTLTKGHVSLAEGQTLTVTESGVLSGGSSTSYIDGELKMKAQTGTAKRFPVGNQNRYGELTLRTVNPSGYYTVRYVNQAPDNSNLADGVSISDNEYWQVKGSAASATMQPQLRWDSQSGVSPTSVRIAMQQPADSWKSMPTTAVGTSTAQGSAYTTKSQTVANTEPTLITFCFEKEVINDGCVWTGLDGTDWNSPANWKNDKMPSSRDKVKIPNTANKPVINTGTVTIGNTLTIEPSATLTLDAACLTMNGEMVCTGVGQFVVQHRIGKAASVITQKTIVNAKVRREMQTLRSYYVGSSNSTGKIDNSAEDKQNMIVLRHDNEDDSWTQVQGEPNLQQVGSIGKYGQPGEVWNLEQIGNIEPLGTKTYELKTMAGETYGWNLIYNDSPVTMNLSRGMSPIKYDSNVSPVIWIRTQTAGNVRVWQTFNLALGEGVNMTLGEETSTGLAQRAIAPYQAFYMQTQNGTADARATGVVTIDMRGQKHVNNVSLKSAGQAEANDVLRVRLQSDGTDVSDEVALVFRDGGSIYPVWSDAEKRMEDAKYNSIAVVKDQKKLAIASLPDKEDVFGTMIEMSVSVPANATEATMTISGIEDLDVEDVILIDKIADVEVSLKEENFYIFAPSELDDQRFALVLKQSEKSEEEGGAQTGTENIGSDLKSVEYFDMMGRRATADGRGVVVEKRNYTDGKAKTQKTLKK